MFCENKQSSTLSFTLRTADRSVHALRLAASSVRRDKSRVVVPWAVALLTAVLLVTSTARAQEWTDGRRTPSLSELVQLDPTGEPGWAHDAEDIAGDGLNAFEDAERAVDLRTLYADTTQSELWIRVYVVGRQAPPDTLTLFVFVNADGNRSTGGSAAATGIEGRLTSDPTAGGYEYVVAVPADPEETPTVYAWTQSEADYVEVALTSTPVTTVGTDDDPLRAGGDERGYVQLRVRLDAVELTQACEGELYVRSTSDNPDVDPGDLSLGDAAADCRPADADSDSVPDAAVPQRCTSDAQCPGTLVCVDGECVPPPSEDTGPRGCTSNAQCPNDLVCVDGQCVYQGADPPSETQGCTNDMQCPGNTVCVDGECVFPAGVSTEPEGCTNNDQCPGDLVCEDGQCVFTGSADRDTAQGCTGNSQCPDGLVCIDEECVFPDRCSSHSDCEANEQCIDGACTPILQEGEEVQGGACTCGIPGHRRSSAPLMLMALGGLLWRRRRSRRTY